MNFWEVVSLVTQVVFWLLGIFGVYNVLVSLGTFVRYRTPEGPDTPYHRFAIVVTARNEEAVIANLINSLHKMDYPSEYYEIFIVADNCTDQTAAIARSLGATVKERFDDKRKSKGYALNWFFSSFFEEYGDQFDSCMIIDADNVVSREYLTVMNQQRNLGKQVVVGYRHGKNPSDSAISGCNSLFWLMQRRAHDQPRAVIGLSLLSTGGSGFVFDLSLIKETGWVTETITEDIEFALTAIEKGVVIGYANTARNYDEQPKSWKVTYKQQIRWKVGTKQLWKMKSGRFLKQVFQGNFRAFDPFMYLQGFPVMIIAPIAWVLSLLSRFMLTFDLPGLVSSVAVAALVGYLLLFVFGVFLATAEGQRWEGQWKAFLLFPIFIVLTSLISYPALFTQNPRWDPIKHEDTRTIEEMQS